LVSAVAEPGHGERTGRYVEQNLRARIRAGDADAFGALFDECARAVYNIAYRLTGNWSTAEEVVSLTFLEAWRKKDRVEPVGESLRPWLLGIAVNVARNASRAERRHREALSRLPPPPLIPDFADELAGRIDDSAQLQRVLDALTTLRRGERELIALCAWSGLDYAEAARALGVPVGTVRSRLSRARRKLSGLLAAADAGSDRRERGIVRGQVAGDRVNPARPEQERTQ
jgi:RNA polymerase sigma factor (sigma-70 family)